MFNSFITRALPDLELSRPPVDCGACSRSPYKCCAFQPFVPNFQMGAILSRHALETLHADDRRYSLQPIGLIARPEFRRRYEAVEEAKRGAEFLCAFYRPSNGTCGIWEERPSECRFYFCVQDARSPERERSSERVFEWEHQTAQMALAELGFTSDEIAEQVDALNGLAAPSDLELEEAKRFYRRCWSWAHDFDKAHPRR